VSFKQNKVKDEKVHQVFLISSLHSCTRVVFALEAKPFPIWNMLNEEVFTLLHEFQWNPADFKQNVRILQNPDGNQLAGASATLVSNSVKILMESHGI